MSRLPNAGAGRVRRAVLGAVLILALGSAARAAAPPAEPAVPVPALFETPPVAGAGDAADDMAIWVNRDDRSQSLIIGTDKKAGNLEVYDLKGERLQVVPDPNHSVNNVDIRYDFPLAGGWADIVVSGGSDVQVYRIDPVARRLVDVTAGPIRAAYDAWGVCLYHSLISGRYYVFTQANNGMVQQLELFDNGAGKAAARSVRGPWDVDPANPKVEDGEIEACVVDDTTGDYYVAEQDVAVWRYAAEPGGSTTDRTAVLTTYLYNGGDLVPDIEGLTIVHDEFASYLLASSQGDSTFGLYLLDESRAPYPLIDKFRVTGGPLADGCSVTDGIDAQPLSLGPDFPHGLFVCQDNTNSAPGSAGHQDFKLVPLERIIPWVNPYGV
ncbi:MAG TPA: phytase [Acidimicrobiia bacterium]|nr:phytase [Acidimicrobiia bacterium]